MKAFKSIREQEYAVDNEETELGARCVAAPILNYQGRPIAAISISGPISYMTGSLVEQIARTLMEATRRISMQLGFAAPVKAKLVP
jgi:DNA-binding IclR family transcriptional regulator